MKKKAMSVLLSAAVTVTAVACGSGMAFADEGSDEEVTLTAFVMQSASTESGIWQGWGAQKLYDDLKIKIDFAPTAEAETSLQQYLVGGDLPDLVGFKGLDPGELAMDADMLLPLDEYQDQLPNIFTNDTYADAIQYSEDNTSNGTGHLYLMPTSIGPTGYNSYNWIPLLQWDAYKQAGSPEVSTLEDYLDVVEKMVEVKPTTETGDKVYGFSLFSDWDTVSASQVATLSFMYGIDTEYVSGLMETNVETKEINSLLDDNSFYKRALKFYYEANQRGLLDPDSMSQTYADVDQKLSAGRTMFTWFSWMTGTYNSTHQDDDNPDGYASVVAKDMKLYVAPDQTIGRNWYFSIAKDCSNLDAALKLLNWMYDPDVMWYLMNGPQGVTWDYDEDGNPTVINEEIVENNTEPLMPEEIGGGALRDGVYAFNTMGLRGTTIMEDYNNYPLSYYNWDSWRNRNPSKLKLEVNAYLGDGVTCLADYVEPNGMSAKSTIAVNMIPVPDDDLQLVITQIGEIVKKYSWQMVYASNEEEFESIWSQMQSEAKELGLDDVTEYYTTEWEKACELAEKYSG
ncbi:MAG: extracellular solute-binding protein [Lachnospiraceae bacterium]|jgi:putative aldouronate transport system substrate-binding protein